jgi:hypothetical protein
MVGLTGYEALITRKEGAVHIQTLLRRLCKNDLPTMSFSRFLMLRALCSLDRLKTTQLLTTEGHNVLLFSIILHIRSMYTAKNVVGEHFLCKATTSSPFTPHGKKGIKTHVINFDHSIAVHAYDITITALTDHYEAD